MSGIPHDHYEPKTNGEKWLNSRLPIVGLIYDTIMIPTPKNLNWWFVFGSLALVVLIIQIVSGIFLTMSYKPAADEAFVLGAMGPLGTRIEPWGPTSREEAAEFFIRQVVGLLEGDVRTGDPFVVAGGGVGDQAVVAVVHRQLHVPLGREDRREHAQHVLSQALGGVLRGLMSFCPHGESRAPRHCFAVGCLVHLTGEKWRGRRDRGGI